MTHSPVAGPCRTMLVVEVKEDVGANGGGKVEGRKGPDGPGVGGSLIIPINRTRGPEVPQSTYICPGWIY